MMILQVNNLQKTFGADLILSNITMEVQSRDRIGLVGRNGAGKSTLLKIVAGELSFDAGDIISPKNVSIGYMAQNTALDSERSIWDEMMTVFEPLVRKEKQLRAMEEKMAGDYDEKLLAEYDQLQETFKNNGGYTYEADIRAVLNGLNFGDFNESTPISNLSGGQKTRLALGKKLLEKPDLLILDEPTNHLDIDTLTWLEGWLVNYPGALVIVSHDRYFLDHTVNQVYEISRNRINRFHGNYSDYLTEKAARYEQDMKTYEKQQKEVAQLEDFIQRNIVRASTTKRAQSRRKLLEKMELMDKPKGDEKSANFSFEIARQSGKDTLRTDDLAFGYEETGPILEHLNLDVKRGERIALIGPNGIGKTTLLKTIAGTLPPIAGNVKHGANVAIGYYDQEQKTLSRTKSALDELWDDYRLTPEKDIRTVLGNFLFSGDDVLKTVAELSGGEKARLSLAKLMMQKANLLILDEPTNHLDLDSKEVLEAALADYPGTILFVSHDRYFINRNATKVLELSHDGMTPYLGDYDYYIEKKTETEELERLEAEENAPEAVEAEPSEGKQAFEAEKRAKNEERRRQRRIEDIEGQIETLETDIEEKEQQLLDPEVFGDHEKAGELNEELEANREKLEMLMEEWTELQT
ncbi:MAG TPA: ABC-F family ATP-binding cassette domain-containing protein [Bacillales bacterium]|nr:ABC-F family ATP-binding cassette domain-containing protein [Bacillales bacterium]